MAVQLILLGAPGSGKGTQSSRLVKNLNYKHISTGELLRREIKEDTDLGRRVDKILKEGSLVENDTVLELLLKNCDVEKFSYVFDGYPRNIEQAKSLDTHLLKKTSSLAIYFQLDTSILISRLVNRRVCEDCSSIWSLKNLPPKVGGVCDKCGGKLIHRSDDKEEIIQKRMEIYNNEISPLLAYYDDSNRLVRIDASQSTEDVYSSLVKTIRDKK